MFISPLFLLTKLTLLLLLLLPPNHAKMAAAPRDPGTCHLPLPPLFRTVECAPRPATSSLTALPVHPKTCGGAVIDSFVSWSELQTLRSFWSRHIDDGLYVPNREGTIIVALDQTGILSPALPSISKGDAEGLEWLLCICHFSLIFGNIGKFSKKGPFKGPFPRPPRLPPIWKDLSNCPQRRGES